MQQRVELRAECLTDRRRDGREFCGELVDGVAEAVAETRPREQRPHTAGRAVKAIGQDASDSIRRLVLERCTLKLPIGLRKGGRTGGLGVA